MKSTFISVTVNVLTFEYHDKCHQGSCDLWFMIWGEKVRKSIYFIIGYCVGCRNLLASSDSELIHGKV